MRRGGRAAGRGLQQGFCLGMKRREGTARTLQGAASLFVLVTEGHDAPGSAVGIRFTP